MKRDKMFVIIIFCVTVLIALIFAPTAFSESTVSIWGTVSQRGTLITKVAEYTIAENDKKLEVMQNVGQEVELVGTVTEADGQRSINVVSYQILQSASDDDGGDD